MSEVLNYYDRKCIIMDKDPDALSKIKELRDICYNHRESKWRKRLLFNEIILEIEEDYYNVEETKFIFVFSLTNEHEYVLLYWDIMTEGNTLEDFSVMPDDPYLTFEDIRYKPSNIKLNKFIFENYG